jgi:hypothetical protein
VAGAPEEYPVLTVVAAVLVLSIHHRLRRKQVLMWLLPMVAAVLTVLLLAEQALVAPLVPEQVLPEELADSLVELPVLAEVAGPVDMLVPAALAL